MVTLMFQIMIQENAEGKFSAMARPADIDEMPVCVYEQKTALAAGSAVLTEIINKIWGPHEKAND